MDKSRKPGVTRVRGRTATSPAALSSETRVDPQIRPIFNTHPKPSSNLFNAAVANMGLKRAQQSGRPADLRKMLPQPSVQATGAGNRQGDIPHPVPGPSTRRLSSISVVSSSSETTISEQGRALWYIDEREQGHRGFREGAKHMARGMHARGRKVWDKVRPCGRGA